MSDIVRIRIQAGQNSIELEGSESWIASHKDELQILVDQLKNGSRTDSATQATAPEQTKRPTEEVGYDNFGELLLTMPNGSSGTDLMLLAGYFAQHQSADQTFATKDANALLLTQGVKIGNPSQCMTNNLKAKRVFKVGGSYRVARPGIEYLAEVRGK